MLDVEDVFINSTHMYEVELENRGDIPVHYNLDAESMGHLTNQFSFEPSKGILGVGQNTKIVITFCPNSLSEFQETFLFNLEVCI